MSARPRVVVLGQLLTKLWNQIINIFLFHNKVYFGQDSGMY